MSEVEKQRQYYADTAAGFAVFDDLPVVQRKFPNLHFLSTRPSGANLYRSAPHLAVVAL